MHPVQTVGKGEAMLKRRQPMKQTERVDTLIGKGTFFKGELKTKGTLRIDGEVDGDIQVEGHAVIGETGRVVAEMSAASCCIAGYFEGKLRSEDRCQITSTGVLIGHATVGALVIEEGARFSGTCEMTVQHPQKEAKLVQKVTDIGSESSQPKAQGE